MKSSLVGVEFYDRASESGSEVGSSAGSFLAWSSVLRGGIRGSRVD